MNIETRRWLPNQRLSCRSRSRSRSNSCETGCGRSIISRTAGSKLRFIKKKLNQENRSAGNAKISSCFPTFLIDLRTSARIPAVRRSLLRSRCVPRIRVGNSCLSRKPCCSELSCYERCKHSLDTSLRSSCEKLCISCRCPSSGNGPEDRECCPL